MELDQTSMRRGVGFFGAFLSATVVVSILLLPDSDYRAKMAIVVALACTVAVRRSLSTLVRSYIAFVALGLLIAPLYSNMGRAVIPETDLLAALWIGAANLGGCLAGMTRNRVHDSRQRSKPDSVVPALIVSTAGLASAYILRSQDSYGITGQLATGISGGGYLGLLAQMGPPSAAGAFLMASRRSQGSTKLMLVLSACSVALQSLTLALSGFRGAGPTYIIVIVICTVDLRQSLRHTSIGKVVLMGTLAMGLVFGLFTVGVSAREDAALSAGLSSSPLSPSGFVLAAIERFDESNYLRSAVEYQDDESARSAVAIRDQITAVVPRFLYPGKPTVDYGPRVSVAVYGAPVATRSSSTVTTFGDALINCGLAGGAGLVAAYVFILDMAFRKLRNASSVRSLSMLAAVVLAALSLENAAILSLIGLLRILLAITAVQWIMERLASSRVSVAGNGLADRIS